MARPSAPGQLHQRLGAVGQGGGQRPVRRQARHQLVLQPPQPGAVAIKLGVALGLQLTRQIAGQGRAADAQLERQQFGRGVVAGDQTPQRVVHDDRHRGGGPHVHVLQILQMDRRHRAQSAVAHVQRHLAGRDRPQRLRRVPAVGNDPHRIAQIERARLAGNVGGGEVVVQEGPGALCARFGYHLAGLVVLEAIDHHPVEAGQTAKGLGGPFAQSLDRGRAFKGGAGGVQAGHQIDAQPRLLRALLDLDDHQIAWQARPGGRRHMDDDVVFQPVGRPPAAGEAGFLKGRHRTDAAIRDVPQDLTHGAVDPGVASGQVFDQARALADRQRLQVQHQHEAVRLDRSGDVDRFAVALGQVGLDLIEGLGQAAASCSRGCRTRCAKAKPSTPPLTI